MRRRFLSSNARAPSLGTDAVVAQVKVNDRRPLWRAPALQAAVIQVIAAAPTLAAVALLAHWHHPASIYGAALLQGSLAALLTPVLRLAAWWIPIQLLFPIALLSAQKLHLPAPVLFGLFVFLLLLFWSTFRTQVPFYPSGPAVWRTVATLLPERPVRVIDIGSGLGGLVIDLARRFPSSELIGIELAPLPWILSVIRARVTRSAAHFLRGDYERLDFADFDVVFAYLSPAAMSALWRKASREMRPASMLVSLEFSIAAKAPDKTILGAQGPALYVWYF
jgi:hypothetical protein